LDKRYDVIIIGFLDIGRKAGFTPVSQATHFIPLLRADQSDLAPRAGPLSVLQEAGARAIYLDPVIDEGMAS